MRLGRFDNYQDAFFLYRSRSAALRNFKQCTGKTPRIISEQIYPVGAFLFRENVRA